MLTNKNTAKKEKGYTAGSFKYVAKNVTRSNDENTDGDNIYFLSGNNVTYEDTTIFAEDAKAHGYSSYYVCCIENGKIAVWANKIGRYWEKPVSY